MLIATQAASPAPKPGAQASAPAKADNRGTKESPLAVEVTAMPERSQEERDEQVAERLAKKDSDRWIVGLTAFIALFTGVLAVVTGFLWHSTKGLWTEAARAGKTAERAASAAQTSAEIASAALVITQRAWMGLRAWRVKQIKDNEKIAGWQFGGVFENSGNTPATNFAGGLTLMEEPVGKELEPFGRIAHEAASIGVVSPRGNTTVLSQTGTDILQFAQAQRMLAGEINVYVCTTVDYRDIFPNTPTRATSVCVQLMIDDKTLAGDPFSYHVHHRYNDAT